jgi:hypothetical protein
VRNTRFLGIDLRRFGQLLTEMRELAEAVATLRESAELLKNVSVPVEEAAAARALATALRAGDPGSAEADRLDARAVELDPGNSTQVH